MFILASGITDEKRKRALLLYQRDNASEKFFANYRIREQQRTIKLLQTSSRSISNLKRIVVTKYTDADFEIEQQIVTAGPAGSSYRIRKKVLRDPTYDLKAILIDGRRDEQSAYQARDIESKEQKNEAIRKLQGTATECRNCGCLYPHTNNCQAKGKQCKKCGKQNHFAKVCRSKPEQKEHPPASQGKRYEHKF
ncbi:Retrovirus-related Pol poly from transposon [Paramuricea clavata]|uniref:Retrovirus-related Pol poly from transposon n=1 Tax=Paramuricea clavata TaxID=317549 RepID=A0A6S7KEG3_PARCT|nr:Retrovirus-related Pol poly from transposon [Paramuricea clavata]